MLVQPLLPGDTLHNLGFDESVMMVGAAGKLMDGLGNEKPREVTVDELKARFFVLGTQVGIAVQMFVFSVVIMVLAYDDATGAIYELSTIYYPLFRGLFMICFFFCCYGVNLFVWKRYGIDYRAILGVSYAHNYHLMMRASFMVMSLVFGSFVLYVLTLRTPRLSSGLDLPSKHIWPATALVGTLMLVAWPRDLMPEWNDCAQRGKLFYSLLRILVSPLFPTNFAATFIADVLTSMPKVFSDLLFTACVYSNDSWRTVEWDRELGELTHRSRVSQCSNDNPTYAAIYFCTAIAPFWLRLMQCCRGFRDTRERKHLYNALKYCTSITVVTLSLYANSSDSIKSAWYAASIISTVYALVWDLKMDWGLPVCSIGHVQSLVFGSSLKHSSMTGHAASHSLKFYNGNLQKERLYPRHFYTIAAGTNTLARLGWAVYISPGQHVVQQHVVLLLGCVELLRRAQWAAIRLEWEQLNREVKREASEMAANDKAVQLWREHNHEMLKRTFLF
ncbi:hypothetical protein AB1Y20_003317 [Prymnesium parvum]|uniref:EXS domain-containing protein n=1 Tax=Prymnesium parvum TaxID=97485 RepID=A0AB34JBI9_PRYPA|mmetsp:Transcript_23867/g.57578  ORF Transcript_23867/g.57578 Transcript_23867/m.57578 type:complete len:504 (+) Transcript_23867:255-1766(+)